MIRELQKYSDLGTPSFLFELIDSVEKIEKKEWRISDFQNLFSAKNIDGIRDITGCIYLLNHIGILKNTKGDLYILSNEIKKYKTNRSKLNKKFISLLFQSLKEDDIFFEIFSDDHISFNPHSNLFFIKNSAFGFRYSRLREILKAFDFMTDHPKLKKTYLLNKSYQDILEEVLSPYRKGGDISVDDLEKSLELKKIYGEQAEAFVYDFEKKRLNSKQSIEWIAKIKTNAGYDIASYNTQKDKHINRYIEVKCYSGKKIYFYLSKNELKISKSIGDQYWLYLVNRDKFNEMEYSPKMIQNPYQEVFTSDKWLKVVENWRFDEI